MKVHVRSRHWKTDEWKRWERRIPEELPILRRYAERVNTYAGREIFQVRVAEEPVPQTAFDLAAGGLDGGAA